MNSGFSLKCGSMALHHSVSDNTMPTCMWLCSQAVLLCEMFAHTIFELKPTHSYIERGHSVIFLTCEVGGGCTLGRMKLYTTLIVILCSVISMWSHC